MPHFVYPLASQWTLGLLLPCGCCEPRRTNLSLSPHFQFSGYIPRNGIVGSDGNYIFFFLRKCYPVFCSDCAVFHLKNVLEQCFIVPFDHERVAIPPYLQTLTVNSRRNLNVWCSGTQLVNVNHAFLIGTHGPSNLAPTSC